MQKVLWVAEKQSQFTQGVFSVMPGSTTDEGPGWVRRGDQWCVWLTGHAFQLAPPDHYLPDEIPRTEKGNKIWRLEDLPILPGPDDWKLIPDASKRARLAKLKELLAWCDVVHHLGDPDAEGQRLVDEALEYFGCRKPVMRILINDYNPKKIREALSSPRNNQDPIFVGWSRWGLARSRYDWLLGMNGTRAMTLSGRAAGHKGVLPVGSVQTPLLYVVRERDREIEHFKPHRYHRLTATLKNPSGHQFIARWIPGSAQQGLDEKGRLVDEAEASRLCGLVEHQRGRVEDFTDQERRTAPPLPLSMNELQMEGFSRYGYTASEVMEAAQRLYDTYKAITYPRTDVRYLSEVHHQEAAEVFASITSLASDLASAIPHTDMARKSKAFDDARLKTPSGEPTPHHGIIPTVAESESSAAWSECEKRVYEMVARAYLAQFAQDYRYRSIDVKIRIAEELFGAQGVVAVDQGWKHIYALPPQVDGYDEDDGGAADNQEIPSIEQGSEVVCTSCTARSELTKAPPFFDDNMLLDAMKNLHRYVSDPDLKKRLKEGEGIGTTATRFKIIEDMKQRELFVKAPVGKRKLTTSSAARNLIDMIPMDVKDPAQAGEFKRSLDRVAAGELELSTFLNQTAQFVQSVIRNATSIAFPTAVEPSVAEPCPSCGSKLLLKNKRTSCAACDFTLWHEAFHKHLSAADQKALLTKHRTKLISGLKNKDKTKTFAAYLVLDPKTGKVSPDFESSTQDKGKPVETNIECPKCKTAFETKGHLIECAKCDLKIWTKVLGRQIESSELMVLLEGQTTQKLSGFTSKSNGKAFSAKLKLSLDTGKYEFIF